MEPLEHRNNKTIPLDHVRQAINIMPYASHERVMFQFLALTGCRVRALDNVKVHNCYENGQVYWHEGKSTRGLRRETLPPQYWQEIREYRKHNNIRSNNLFGMTSETFTRLFSEKVRPLLGSDWNQRVLVVNAGCRTIAYKYQIKFLRKNYQTILFAQELARWKNADTALLFTSKRMRHKTREVTAYNYLEVFDTLDTTRSVEEQLKGPLQKRLDDYNIK